MQSGESPEIKKVVKFKCLVTIVLCVVGAWAIVGTSVIGSYHLLKGRSDYKKEIDTLKSMSDNYHELTLALRVELKSANKEIAKLKKQAVVTRWSEFFELMLSEKQKVAIDRANEFIKENVK